MSKTIVQFNAGKHDPDYQYSSVVNTVDVKGARLIVKSAGKDDFQIEIFWDDGSVYKFLFSSSRYRDFVYNVMIDALKEDGSITKVFDE